MTDTGITYLLWHDLVGLTRTRGIPSRNLKKVLADGVGWACAGQALTPFQDIVENPWGPMDEVRQVPDPSTLFTISGDDHTPAFNAVICDSKNVDGSEWDCCGRSFLKAALADLHRETGLGIYASFEHEFSITGDGFNPSPPFSIEAARQQNKFLTNLERALHDAGVSVSTIEPEFGLGQYEVACTPEVGMAAADKCLVGREVIREIARRRGLHASFTPKPAADAVGNGAHVHMSLINENGENQTYDPEGLMNLSKVARQFSAGILAHLEALVAITAPTPISYYRLGPHHWSCGFRAIGLQNREAALRVTPGIGDENKKRKGHNLEYRPCDGTASPYLVLGTLVRAGLEGIRTNNEALTEVTKDPAEMSEKALQVAGVTPLPASLDIALAALANDPVARTWFSPKMHDIYQTLKLWEIDQAKNQPEDALFERYRATY